MSEPRIPIPSERIAEYCRKHGIRKLALYGSVLREDFQPESDVDVLVEFEDGMKVGWEFFGMERELANILRRRVDLNTKGFLGKFVKERVLAEARVIYDAA